MTSELEIERKYLLKYNPLNLGGFDNLLQITQLYLPKDENGYSVRYRYVTDTNAKRLKRILLRVSMKRLKRKL